MFTKEKSEAKKERVGRRGTGYRYSAEFRREALRMIDAGKSPTAVSKELGVSLGTLGQWRLKAEAVISHGGGSGSGAESLTAANDRLKRELKVARMELEIVKKAAALFARHGV